MIALDKTYSGNLGGVAKADELCREEAAEKNRIETYRAFLGSSVQKIKDIMPWASFGTPIFNINVRNENVSVKKSNKAHIMYILGRRTVSLLGRFAQWKVRKK